MTEIDRAQLAALDASGMHNTGRMQFEYGEFDTVKVKDEDGASKFDIERSKARLAYTQRAAERAAIITKSEQFPSASLIASISEDEWNDWDASAENCVAGKSLIQQRSETHGDFSVNSQVSQAIKRAIRTPKKYMELHDFQKEALEMVAGKIGRIIAGDGNFPDHWRDIAGYAQLVLDRVEKLDK